MGGDKIDLETYLFHQKSLMILKTAIILIIVINLLMILPINNTVIEKTTPKTRQPYLPEGKKSSSNSNKEREIYNGTASGPIEFGLAYIPHNWGARDRSGHVVSQKTHLMKEDWDYPFNRTDISFSENWYVANLTHPLFRARVQSDLWAMKSMGVTAIRLHLLAAIPENLDYAKWITSEMKRLNFTIYLDIIGIEEEITMYNRTYRVLDWNGGIDLNFLETYVSELSDNIDIWNVYNEQVDKVVAESPNKYTKMDQIAEIIRENDDECKIFANIAGWKKKSAYSFAETVSNFDGLGVDLYPVDIENFYSTLNKTLEEIRDFEDDTGLELIISECGVHIFHNWWNGVEENDTQKMRNGIFTSENVRRFSDLYHYWLKRFAQTPTKYSDKPLFRMIFGLWFEEIFTLRNRCIHCFTSLNRELSPYGNAFIKAVSEINEIDISYNTTCTLHFNLTFYQDIVTPFNITYSNITQIQDFIESLEEVDIIFTEGTLASSSYAYFLGEILLLDEDIFFEWHEGNLEYYNQTLTIEEIQEMNASRSSIFLINNANITGVFLYQNKLIVAGMTYNDFGECFLDFIIRISYYELNQILPDVVVIRND